MATVTVTFAAAFPSPSRVNNAPIPVGSSARSEQIDTEATDPTSVLSAAAGEHMARVIPSADCWVAIGASPDTASATDGTREAWLVKSGAVADFLVATGDSVAVEAVA